MPALPRVLCVDDDPGVAKLLDRLFEEAGKFEYAFEADPEKALQVARVFQPDLFVLDVNMPGLSGVELARQIREVPEWRERPIVMFTGLVGGQMPSPVALAGGNVEFLPKGAPMRVIFATIYRLLGI